MKPLLLALSLTLATAAAQAPLDQLLVPINSPTKTDANHTTQLPAPTHSRANSQVATNSNSNSPTLGAEAFLTAIEHELTKHLSLTGELKLSLSRPWSPLKLPAPDYSIVVAEWPTNGITGTFLVRVKISSDGELVADWLVPLQAQLWQDVWVANTRLERGQALDRSLLASQKFDTLRERQPPISAQVDPSSLELTNSITAGRPLTRHDVSIRPIIRKGQIVEVSAQQGLLSITMKALALENGAAGDLIKLRNLESRREINGQIINENKVRIPF